MNASGRRKGRTTVLVVEDHEIWRRGLVNLIGEEPDLVVCGQAGALGDVRETVQQLRPDVAVVGVALKDGSAMEVIKNLHARQPGLAILVLSMYDGFMYAERVLRAGALGYVSKSEPSGKVLEAIRRVAAGDVYVGDGVASTILSRLSGGGSARQFPTDQLTDRELEVFELIGEGLQTREIAARLHLSRKTVEAYRENIKHKLGLENAARMIVQAVQWVQLARGS